MKLLVILLPLISFGISKEEIQAIKKEAFTNLLRLSDSNLDVRSKAFRVQLDIAEGDLGKLESDVIKLVKDYPKLKDYWFFNIGQYYTKQNNFKKAMAFLGKIDQSSEYFEKSVLMIAEVN